MIRAGLCVQVDEFGVEGIRCERRSMAQCPGLRLKTHCPRVDEPIGFR